MGNTEIFERIAADYDTAERIAVAKRIAAEIRTGLTDTRQKRALDYGCGTGLVGLQLVDCFADLLFVDASAAMIEQVQSKIAAGGLTTAAARCRDFGTGELPVLDVDYILLSQVLLHVPDHTSLLRRLYELLNPGGQVIIVDFDKNEKIISDQVHNGFDQAELTEVLKRIGFAAVRSQTFYQEQKLFMNQEASLFIMQAGK